MMRNFYAPPFLLAAFSCLAIFWIGSFLTTANNLSEVLRVLQIPLVCAVVVAYVPDALAGAFARRPSGLQQLTLGIVCAWIGVVGSSGWALLFRLGDKPIWMLNSDFPNFFTALSLFGAALHITAPGALNGVPKKSMVVLGLGLGMAVACFVSFVFMHPDVRGFTDALRPYLEDKRSSYRGFYLDSDPVQIWPINR